MKNKYVLSIDPSVNNVGWALSKDKKLIKFGVIHPSSRKIPYIDKCKEIIVEIRNLIKYPEITQIVTEIPDHFGDRGYMARESGAILKLAFVAGMIFNMDSDVIAYTPSQWKGGLPKHVMTMRMCKKEPYKSMKIVDWEDVYHCNECHVKHPRIIMDHNTIDAIGINHKHCHGRV